MSTDNDATKIPMDAAFIASAIATYRNRKATAGAEAAAADEEETRRQKNRAVGIVATVLGVDIEPDWVEADLSSDPGEEWPVIAIPSNHGLQLNGEFPTFIAGYNKGRPVLRYCRPCEKCENDVPSEDITDVITLGRAIVENQSALCRKCKAKANTAPVEIPALDELRAKLYPQLLEAKNPLADVMFYQAEVLRAQTDELAAIAGVLEDVFGDQIQIADARTKYPIEKPLISDEDLDTIVEIGESNDLGAMGVETWSDKVSDEELVERR